MPCARDDRAASSRAPAGAHHVERHFGRAPQRCLESRRRADLLLLGRLRQLVRLHHCVVRGRVVVDERRAVSARDARRRWRAVARAARSSSEPFRVFGIAATIVSSDAQPHPSARPRIHRPASGPRWRTPRAAREGAIGQPDDRAVSLAQPHWRDRPTCRPFLMTARIGVAPTRTARSPARSR